MEDSGTSLLSTLEEDSTSLSQFPLDGYADESQDSISVPILKKPKLEDDESTNDGESNKKVRMSRLLTQDTIHMQIEVDQVIEYEWPLKSNIKYFIQEQIAELLDIKSFKRKYPDLTRRPVEVNERNYLVDVLHLEKVLPKHMLSNLTALRSSEIHQLMSQEHPEKYADYQRVSSERAKAALAEQQKMLQALKSDSKQLEIVRKKAMENCSRYNSFLQEIKKKERFKFVDLQTGVIQEPQNLRYRASADETKIGEYPVALLQGQYTDGYKIWSPDELKKLPLSTAIETETLYPIERPVSPIENLEISEEEHKNYIKKREEEEDRKQALLLQQNPDTPLILNKDGKIYRCSNCSKQGTEENTIECAKCNKNWHPECLNMPSKMATVVKNYDWHCAECRICTVCNKINRDDQVMFCDVCDRGYHTFCVGIQRPPEGTWFCGKFCVTDGKCQKCSSILVEKKTPSRGRPPRKPVAPVDKIVQTISGMCDECTEKYKCRVNRLISISESFDSQITWLLTQDCLLYIKLDWQMKFFIKKGLDFTKMTNNNCILYTKESKIFINVNGVYIYIIRFYYTPSKIIEAVINRINYIKMLQKTDMEYVKIKAFTTDTFEDHDYIKILPISVNTVRLPLDCVVLYNETIQLKCLEKKHDTLFLLSYILNSKNIFKFDNKTELKDIKYDQKYNYKLFVNYNKLFVILSDHEIKSFILIKEISDNNMVFKNNTIQNFMKIPSGKEKYYFYGIISTINNIGVILDYCHKNIKNEKDIFMCKAYFIKEGYFSKNSACVFKFLFDKQFVSISGLIPLNNFKKLPTTLYRKNECINEIFTLLKGEIN
uniref:PHD finger protein 10 n=1 Tax=Strongyloides stercoralis TaxID=6248 RepID=A0A0K0ENH4_STRER